MTLEDLEKLLSKYIAVWIWSILFGASSGLIYSLIEYRPEKWGQLAVTLLLFSAIGIVFAFLSLILLIRYLIKILLPTIFRSSDSAQIDSKLSLLSVAYLSRATWFLVFAAIARAGMAIAELIFVYLQRL